MAMEITKLNLARKWRSQSFENIIGQDLAIKMLKNSLYAGHYFPVYLFSGQRGCGKTTTARVFASALNCEQLLIFQKKPRETALPCGICVSCVAVREGRHQDFIEMDAASHTGVDTIRQLIEDAAFLPVIGRKRVYLIDEAHMLSKAAFNALLKILEEPPASAIFILATTDAEKILETVRSRCFTIQFKSIKTAILLSHLLTVCQTEKIAYKEDGLAYIASHADGSARDALNMLEQVRFSSGIVNRQAVLTVLGHIDDVHLIELLKTVAAGSLQRVLLFWQQHSLQSVSIEFVWRRLLILARSLVWLHNGVSCGEDAYETEKLLKDALSVVSLSFLHQLMEALYKSEPLFIRTTAQQGLLEMVLLQLCTKKRITSSGESGSAVPMGVSPASEIIADGVVDEESDNQQDDDEQRDDAQTWQAVCTIISSVGDPLLASLFSQSMLRSYNASDGYLDISFPSRLSFFADKLEEGRAQWQSLLQTHFGPRVQLRAHFDGNAAPLVASVEQQKENVEKKIVEKNNTHAPRDLDTKSSFGVSPKSYQRQVVREVREKRFDVSDVQRWQKVNLVLKHFPGTVTEVQEV